MLPQATIFYSLANAKGSSAVELVLFFCWAYASFKPESWQKTRFHLIVKLYTGRNY